MTRLSVAEFFAGAGLVRMALEPTGCRVVFANDIDPTKHRIYAANFDDADFHLGDVTTLRGSDIPEVDIATASFPCTDLSLAGARAGLNGKESSLIWQFLRIVDEMGAQRPRIVLLENVPGFATSNKGRDLRDAAYNLNQLGYDCDILAIDARRFVPQSRLRVFIVASLKPLAEPGDWLPPELRPSWIAEFAARNPDLRLTPAVLSPPADSGATLADVVERFSASHEIWWDVARAGAFLSSLSKLQAERLEKSRRSAQLSWSTAYRRTRGGQAVWEIRPDNIAGCLRTTRGGSSKQALVEAGRGNVRIRWLTAREYARLQGARKIRFGEVTESQARFAMGDAVCVPVLSWLAENYLVPLAVGSLR